MHGNNFGRMPFLKRRTSAWNYWRQNERWTS